MLSAVLFGLSGAAAQTAASDQPLAIPAAEPSPAAQRAPGTRPPAAEITIRAPGGKAGQAAAMRSYRDQHLSLRRSSDVVTGTSVAWAFQASPAWGTVGWVPWPQPWAYRVDRIGVVQGQSWLDVPSILGAMGDTRGQRDLERKIQRNRNATSFLQGIAVVGVGSIVAGLVGTDRAVSYDELRTWQRVTGAGVTMTVGGLMLSAIPGTRADRLRYDVQQSFTLDELRDRVADHNDALAAELGLDPEIAVQLEMD